MKGKTARQQERKRERKKGRNLIAVVRGRVYDRDAYLSMTVRLFLLWEDPSLLPSSSSLFALFSVNKGKGGEEEEWFVVATVLPRRDSLSRRHHGVFHTSSNSREMHHTQRLRSRKGFLSFFFLFLEKQQNDFSFGKNFS
jgi:hypothetical protein